MYKWFLPTLSEVVASEESAEAKNLRVKAEKATTSPHRRIQGQMAQRRARAEWEWTGAIAALNSMLQQAIQGNYPHPAQQLEPQGIVLSGPLPILGDPALTTRFASWTFTFELLNLLDWMPFQLLPAGKPKTAHNQAAAPETVFPEGSSHTAATLSLLPGDPLAAEKFCLVLTRTWSLVMVLGESRDREPTFAFSFEPEVVQQAWQALRARVLLTSAHQLNQLDALVEQFVPTAPHYKTVMEFSRLLLEHLPNLAIAHAEETVGHPSTVEVSASDAAWDFEATETGADLELLRAIAHEVRTPLATIRTLTRLLLKRRDLAPEVMKRLEVIDHECTEQIDRFNLIFRAVELETSEPKRSPMQLTTTSLAQVFQQSIPRWQKQASRRNLTLDVVLPQKMPRVVSDPTMLDQVLTGLIERFTRSLPSGNHIQVQVMLAGNQLKLQLHSQPHAEQDGTITANGTSNHMTSSTQPILKSLGQLLMFQPETGCLSLNLAVTKNLFQALGGKLIVRQRPQQGEVMTVFLPLDGSIDANPHGASEQDGKAEAAKSRLIG